MDDTELQAVIQGEIEDAVSFIDSDIGPERAKAVDYYFGRLFGDEEEGRSKVVSRDVHDTIQAIEPSLMRIFFSPEHVVEFSPNGEEDVEMAEQATDYVNYVFTRDNDGFSILASTIRNALREKVGIVKYWWDESVEVTTQSYTGIDEMQLQVILEDLSKAVEAEIVSSSEDENGLSVELKLKRRIDRARCEAVPPEEFLITRRAASIDEASFCAHRTMKTVSDLVAMGYDREVIEANAQDTDDFETSDESLARNWSRIGPIGVAGDASQRLVLYVEAYVLADVDDDGIAELMKVCCVGSGYKVVHSEPAPCRPFADFHCDPEPHAFFGQSIADKTMDVQRVKSAVWRASLDSLAQSIYPRTVVVENDGNIEDALNPEVGAVLRAKSPNGYQTLVTPFVGEQAFPMLTYMDQVRDHRTGTSRVSMGLDAEALQNTTATAAEGQFTRSQDRIDLIARVLANGMRKLYRGLLRLVVTNQRKERVVKLRGKWTPVDPRAWRVDMDVICNVGLGGGSDAAKAKVLFLLAEKQEQIIQAYGIDNPLCGVEELRNTYAKLAELHGFKNVSAFFKDLPKDEEGNLQIEAPPTPPDPKMIEVQGKMQLEQAKAQFDAQASQQKAQTDIQLRQMELQAQAELKRLEMQEQTALKREQLVMEMELKRELAMAEFELKRELGYMSAEVSREIGHAKVEASSDIGQVNTGGEPG